MPTNFAVIDAGSNAIRLQIAAVEQPGTYRIIEQDRRPARLGHKVFETGALDPESRGEALDVARGGADRAEMFRSCSILRAGRVSRFRMTLRAL